MKDLLSDEEQEYLKVVAFTLLRYGKWEKARLLYEALAELRPQDMDVSKGLAVSSFQSGKHSQALAGADRWLHQPPFDEREARAVRLFRARILWALGRHQEARESLS